MLENKENFPLCTINILVNQEHNLNDVLHQAINISKILNCSIYFKYKDKKVYVKPNSDITIGLKNFEIKEISVITW